MKEVIVRITSIPGSKIKAYKDLPSELNAKVDLVRFKNEMALIDLDGHSTLYGADGVAYIFSSRYKLAEWLLKIKPLFILFRFLYRLQAYNRYIIAAPKSKFGCDCFPDKHPFYRKAYIGIAFSISILLTMLFGVSLTSFFDHLSRGDAAVQMLLMAGTGWTLQLALASLFLQEKKLDYAGHLGSIMVAGLLILVPWMVFKWITGIEIMFFPMLSVAASSLTMLYLHIHRVKYLQISQGWTISWFLLLQSSALFWVYFFYFKS